MASNIDGVVIKQIARHHDDRGYFAELMKESEPGFHKIAQTSYAITKPGVIKAFHYHDYWETWVVIEGEAQVVMFDGRDDSSTKGMMQVLLAGETHPIVLSIPPMVQHGYRAIGTEDVGMLYHAEEAYDPAKKDQIMITPFDSKDIGFDWNKAI